MKNNELRRRILEEASVAYGLGDHDTTERYTDVFRVSLDEKPREEIEQKFKELEEETPLIKKNQLFERLMPTPLSKLKICWEIANTWNVTED